MKDTLLAIFEELDNRIESALVSKAVKAKEKNKVLIIDAIASGEFPNLVERIEANDGDLEYFVGDENEDE